MSIDIRTLVRSSYNFVNVENPTLPPAKKTENNVCPNLASSATGHAPATAAQGFTLFSLI